ncbi:collagen binding domain-containing protein [Lysinibacillus sp. 54212]|uniref:collagen binding domain-containing protein n=1 Tax=Lysinibacillus sp. 54212 TaxID=3119829 RepID=UPI002FCBF871
MKKLNITILLVLLVFQTILSPISVFANETDPLANVGVTEPVANANEQEATPTENVSEPVANADEEEATPPTETATEPIANVAEEETAPPTGNSTEPVAKAEDGEVASTELAETEKEDLSGQITDVQVSLKESSTGEDLTSTSKELAQTTEAAVNYVFTVDLGQGANVGDYFTFKLPKSLIDYSSKFNGSYPKGAVNPIYTYSTALGSDGKYEVTVTFNQKISPVENAEYNSSKAEIKMDFNSKFTLSGESLEQELVVPDGISGEKTISLTFLPSTANKKVTKTKGNVSTVDGKRQIEWAVWVNEAGKELVNATLTDTPGTGHAIKAGTVNIAQYTVGLKGVIDKSGAGTSVLANGNWSDVNAKLTGKNAYKVTYKTEVNLGEPEGNTTLINTVKFKHDNISEETANGSVTLTYGDALKKELVSGNNYKTSWAINYNYNLAKRTNPVITDTLSSETNAHMIDIDSIRVFEVTVDGSGNATGTPKEVTDPTGTLYSVVPEGANGFKLSFASPVEKAYRIIYDAKYLDDYYTKKTPVTLSNTVTAEGIASHGKHTATHDISQGILKKSRTIDFDKKEIHWKITVTADSKDISGLTIDDTFYYGTRTGKHTLIVPDKHSNHGIDLSGMTGTIELKDPTDLSQGFFIKDAEVKQGETGIITYVTSFAIEENGEVATQGYGNEVNASWASYSIKYVRVNYEPKPTSVNNGSKSGSYNYENQTFTWGVKVNINKKNINNALLTDTLGEGHEIVPGSIKVYNYTLVHGDSSEDDTKGDKGSELSDTHYGVNLAPDNKSFTLTFNDNLPADVNNKVYLVEYNTKDSDDIIGIGSTDKNAAGNVYSNIAKFQTLGTQEFTLPATPVTVNDANSLLKKEVESQSAPVVTWLLDINKSLSALGDVTLTDTPSEMLMLVPGSIKIRPYKVTATGVSEGDAWQDATGVTYNEDGGFTLPLGDLTHKGYQVKYETLAFGAKDDLFSNNAKISYAGATSANQQTSIETENKQSFSNSSSDFSATKGNAKFVKIGKNAATGIDTALEGVQFQLIKKIGNKEYIIGTKESKADGTFTFENINYGKYIIREVAAPAGYTKMDDFPFELDETKDTLKEPTVETELINTVDESKMCANYTLTLKDADGNVRPNVKVKLVAQGGTEFEYTTATNGTISVPRATVAPGVYKVIELNEDDTEKLVLTESINVKYSENDCSGELQLAPACSDFTFVLKDADGEVLKNTIFEMTVNNKNADGTTTSETYTLTTDNDGKQQLPSTTVAGTYEVKDTSGKKLGDLTVSYLGNCQGELQPYKACDIFTITVKGQDANIKPNAKVIVEDSSGTEVSLATDVTDANGKIQLPQNQAPGEYTVYEQNTDSTKGDEIGKVKVTYTGDCTGEVIKNACPAFTLTVNNKDLQPVGAGVGVTIKDQAGAVVTSGTTDANGQIAFTDKSLLQQGVAYEVYNSLGRKLGDITVSYIDEVCGAAVAVPDNVCPQFALTVQNVSGVARPGVTVTIKDESGATTIATATTDSNGVATVPYTIEPGKYRVYEGASILGTITVTDTCIALVKPSSGGGGWIPPEPPVDPENPDPENPDPENPVDPENPDPENPDPGKPVDPENPDPENPDPGKPIDPENPDPENPGDNLGDNDGNNQGDNKGDGDSQGSIKDKEDKLPQTDGASQTAATLIGLLLVAISGTLLFVRRRKTA